VYTNVKTITASFFKTDIALVFPNYQDYGYGIFLLDEKSRDYVQKISRTKKTIFCAR
jgi:hypothetical protein